MKVDEFFLLEHVAGSQGFLAVSAVVFIELELFLQLLYLSLKVGYVFAMLIPRALSGLTILLLLQTHLLLLAQLPQVGFSVLSDLFVLGRVVAGRGGVVLVDGGGLSVRLKHKKEVIVVNQRGHHLLGFQINYGLTRSIGGPSNNQKGQIFDSMLMDQYLCLRMPAKHALQIFSGAVGNISECTRRSVMDSSSPFSTDIASVVNLLHMRWAQILPFSELTRPVAQSHPFQQMAMEGLQLHQQRDTM